MTETNSRSIHDQPDLSQAVRLSFQPLLGNRLVPFPYTDSRILQKAAQALGGTEQQCSSGDLPGNLAQMHRTTFIDTNHQPNEVPDLSDPLRRSQFTNSSQPSIIEAVGRHELPPFLEMFRKTILVENSC